MVRVSWRLGYVFLGKKSLNLVLVRIVVILEGNLREIRRRFFVRNLVFFVGKKYRRFVWKGRGVFVKLVLGCGEKGGRSFSWYLIFIFIGLVSGVEKIVDCVFKGILVLN